MNMRTESEIRAYIDGYNACFNQFCESLKGRKSVADAIRKMKLYQAAVNNVVDKEKNHEENNISTT